MNVSQEIWQGAELMVIGMGTVFLFLSLLVFLMKLMEKLLAGQPSALVSQSLPVSPPHEEEETAAVVAALHHHRQRNQKSPS